MINAYFSGMKLRFVVGEKMTYWQRLDYEPHNQPCKQRNPRAKDIYRVTPANKQRLHGRSDSDNTDTHTSKMGTEGIGGGSHLG
ncbi:hypothetical protein DPMN_142362 [Dreissena polymorpha]|uniref:Uncharacterized protein n=1 Tax=Dreissena polymorpha TaxID=45954 RepID=A0A9D4JNE6_DREPO|nr:hypothetical protein DPMN_142362 [Dreissena polymorpha]